MRMAKAQCYLNSTISAWQDWYYQSRLSMKSTCASHQQKQGCFLPMSLRGMWDPNYVSIYFLLTGEASFAEATVWLHH